MSPVYSYGKMLPGRFRPSLSSNANNYTGACSALRQEPWAVGGGEEIQVLGTMKIDNFAIAGHGVYFNPVKTPAAFQFLNFTTGKVTTIATLTGEPASGFSLASDERSLLFSQYEDHGSDLMLVENFR
jgi:hypothetical protein